MTVIELNKEYEKSKANISSNAFFSINDEIQDNLLKNVKHYLNEAIKIKKDYESNKIKLTTDEVVWLDSLIFNYNLEKENYELNLRYLGGNPSDNSLMTIYPLSFYQNYVFVNLEKAINIFKLDPVTLAPILKDNKPIVDYDVIQSSFKLLNDFHNYLQNLEDNLTVALEKKIVPSIISTRLLIKELLEKMYFNELEHIADNLKEFVLSETNFDKLLKDSPTNFALSHLQEIQDFKMDDNFKQDYINLLIEIQDQLNEFIKFYIFDYFNTLLDSSNKTGFGGSLRSLIYTKQTNDKEVEKTYVSKNKNTLFGLGLSTLDLNTKNIGLGFMNNPDGNNLYKQLVKISTTTSMELNDIYHKGLENTKMAVDNMVIVGQTIGSIKQDKNKIWSETINFNEDGINGNEVQSLKIEITNNGKLNFANFSQWLNDEKFFYGREPNWTSEMVSLLVDSKQHNEQIEKQFKITKSEYDAYKDYLKTFGYWSAWNADEKVGTIKSKQALAACFTSFRDYNLYKNINDPYMSSFFNKIPNYTILVYDKKFEAIKGVGEEGLRGSNKFSYNANPYYSLQKWSISSFTNHESKMGHHTQQAYWVDYMPQINNEEGPYFYSTSYHEGWAVFVEWFAVEIGLYGVPNQKNENGVPTDFLNALSFVPKNKDIVHFQNGCYWDDLWEVNETNINNAIKIANMCHYYGYLNEAQLRNIRLCVDTAYHCSNLKNEHPNLKGGSSIQDIRDFMQSNSALGVGDISNEAIRYLTFPGQATSYMVGKEVIYDVYKAIKDKYTKQNNSSILEDKQYLKKVFDLLLRNGEIPLDVLKKVMLAHFA